MASVLSYLPSPLTVIREFVAIASAEDPELSALWSALGDSINDQFIDDATQTGIERWESQLELTPKATDSLDTRRAVIKAKISEQLPYTHRVLDRRLKTLCGEGGYTLDVNVEGYTVTVRVALTSKEVFDNVDAMLEDIVPLNMVLDVDLLYNQHQTLAQYTHAHLGMYTHEQLKSDAIDVLGYSQLEGVLISNMEGAN